jgi:DNA modification methylase
VSVETYHQDEWLTVLLGDCREAMATLEPESVHCVVTSPPYWGLRDYGTATWLGGDEACDHLAPPRRGSGTYSATSTLGPKRDGLGPDNAAWQVTAQPYAGTCGKCGATRQDSQLGLEPTPEAYVESMVAVFREVRRVLRSDGTVWLNLGDSYAGSASHSYDGMPALAQRSRGGSKTLGDVVRPKRGETGLAAKQLVGIPWRVAFALQADGWYLRSDIIWSKPNPMPESVTDRPTKSHEYLFLLSKKPTYYFDADAVREPHAPPTQQRFASTRRTDAKEYGDQPTNKAGTDYTRNTTFDPNSAGRNIRSVWTIATQPYPGAHFATFPRKLVEPCIKAGSPEGGTVLDPFAGSGTTGLVAQQLSRRAVLIDLSAEYLGQVLERNAAMPLGLTS